MYKHQSSTTRIKVAPRRIHLAQSYLHLGGDEVGDVAPVLLLGIAHEGERAVVYLDDVLLAVFTDQQLDGADVEAAKKLGHVVDPGTMPLRHRQLLQHRRARVRLPVATDALAPGQFYRAIFIITYFRVQLV